MGITSVKENSKDSTKDFSSDRNENGKEEMPLGNYKMVEIPAQDVPSCHMYSYYNQAIKSPHDMFSF